MPLFALFYTIPAKREKLNNQLRVTQADGENQLWQATTVGAQLCHLLPVALGK